LTSGGDDPELFGLAEDLSTNLQLCDQFTCEWKSMSKHGALHSNLQPSLSLSWDSAIDSNVFIYFQPGAGKINIDEPTKQVLSAMKKLGDIMDALNAI
jgi:hypothetical protein